MTRTAKNKKMTIILTSPKIVAAISNPRRTLSATTRAVVTSEAMMASILKIQANILPLKNGYSARLAKANPDDCSSTSPREERNPTVGDDDVKL